MIRHESKFYQNLKKITPTIRWTRLENWASFGTPDLLGYTSRGHFFTVELKVAKSNKVAKSPHQVAWHMSHPSGSFVLVRSINKKKEKNYVSLYPGSRILELVDSGLRLEPAVRGTLEACACSLIDFEPVPVV